MSEGSVVVVMHLNRWERTTVALSLSERIQAAIKGWINLEDMLGYDSIGWAPVFRSRMDADAYAREVAPSAPILTAGLRWEGEDGESDA